MSSDRIIIALNGDSQLMKVRNLLVEHGYEVVSTAKDGQECIRKARSYRPNLALIDYELPQYTGYEIAKILAEDRICSVILLVNDSQKSFINEHINQLEITCLLKPINISGLISTIELTIKSDKTIRSLKEEVEGLKNKIETKKVIERAKGLLMKKYGLNEEEAFRRIQKQSMDKRISMMEVSKSIIIACDI